MMRRRPSRPPARGKGHADGAGTGGPQFCVRPAYGRRLGVGRDAAGGIGVRRVREVWDGGPSPTAQSRRVRPAPPVPPAWPQGAAAARGRAAIRRNHHHKRTCPHPDRTGGPTAASRDGIDAPRFDRAAGARASAMPSCSLPAWLGDRRRRRHAETRDPAVAGCRRDVSGGKAGAVGGTWCSANGRGAGRPDALDRDRRLLLAGPPRRPAEAAVPGGGAGAGAAAGSRRGRSPPGRLAARPDRFGAGEIRS